MALVVHHYFPLGSDNVGDLLVARAIRQAFVRHFGDTHFVDMPANDHFVGDRPIGLSGGNVDHSNREADLILVGGSNMLEPRKSARRRLSKKPAWGFFTDVPSIRRLAPPLLLIGMGTGSSFGKRIRPYSIQAREEIRCLHERALMSAVRDVTTVQALARIGVGSECTGCPVTFLTDRPIVQQSNQLPLLVSLPPARVLKRFGGQAFMRLAWKYLTWLQRRHIPCVVTLHEACDRYAAPRWVPPGVDIFYTEDVDELIGRFESSRGVIGFRLHAALLGMGLGKPIVPVGVDWRGLAFIKTFELEDLSSRPFRFGQLRKLCRLTERLLEGEITLLSRLDAGKAHFRARHEAFFADAARRFNALRQSGSAAALVA